MTVRQLIDKFKEFSTELGEGSEHDNGDYAQSEKTKKKELTILLLGETGVGKSTFINGFYHYLQYETLDDAAKDITCLIPTHFTIYDPVSREKKSVVLGDPDPNESNRKTESNTKAPKCHKFEFGDFTINLIDTPGIGDTNGMRTDDINMQMLLEFIREYKEINAICILLKPNNARVTIVFKYCIMELLRFLSKSASENILFLFTNARSTFYMPGDTGPALEELLQTIKRSPPHVDIAFNQQTTYCFDNESFRYLVAVTEPNCVQFNKHMKDEFERSWRQSVEECGRMIEHISKLRPHSVQDTISVNNARANIFLLTQPLGDITKNISDNIQSCEIQKQKINECKTNIEELNRNLFTPVIDIVSTPLQKPQTVCGDPNCCEKKNVNGIIKEHYKRICHSPCYLDLDDGSVMGNKGLLDCRAFNKYIGKGDWHWAGKETLVPDNDTESDQIWCETVSSKEKSEICFECGHSFESHLHTFYKTEVVNRQIRDETKFKRITTNEEAMKAKAELIGNLETRINELKGESLKITEISANFAYFLKENAIISYNDVFEEYFQYLMKVEKHSISLGSDKANFETLNEMLHNYHNEKKIVENLMKTKQTGNNANHITPETIDNYIKELFKLKHSGNNIQRHLSMQVAVRTHVHNNQRQVVHKVKKNIIKRGFNYLLGRK